MKINVLILCALAPIFLNACDSGGGNSSPSATTYLIADYYPVELPPQTTRCTTTYEEVVGNSIGATITLTNNGTIETINYLSGALTGHVLEFSNSVYSINVVYYNDGSSFKTLRTENSIASSDCNLTSYPDALIYGEISDGLVKTITDYSMVSNSGCTTFSATGDYRGYKELFRIADITIRDTQYNNAIVIYQLDIGVDYMPLNYNGNYGIPLPDAKQTQGHAISEIFIFALGEGEIARLTIDTTTGNIQTITERASFSCQ